MYNKVGLKALSNGENSSIEKARPKYITVDEKGQKAYTREAGQSNQLEPLFLQKGLKVGRKNIPSSLRREALKENLFPGVKMSLDAEKVKKENELNEKHIEVVDGSGDKSNIGALTTFQKPSEKSARESKEGYFKETLLYAKALILLPPEGPGKMLKKYRDAARGEIGLKEKEYAPDYKEERKDLNDLFELHLKCLFFQIDNRKIQALKPYASSARFEKGSSTAAKTQTKGQQLFAGHPRW